MDKLDSNDDVALTARLKAGDEKAFYDIYIKYHKHLYCIALKYLKNQNQAEDALQDVFLKLWSNKERLNEYMSVKGFLYTSLKNHVLNILRDYKSELVKNAEISNSLPLDANITEDDMILAEYSAIVNSGIEQLSPQRRTIFKLRTFQGLTNDEVATHLGISINTVKFQFSQATKFLRHYLNNNSDIRS